MSVVTSSGPFRPQESLMWNAQLPPLLEKRERKKEGRKRGRPARLRISAVGPDLCFLGLQAVCVGGVVAWLSPGTGPSPRSGDGPDRPPLWALCQHLVAGGRVEPEFPTSRQPARVMLRVQRF